MSTEWADTESVRAEVMGEGEQPPGAAGGNYVDDQALVISHDAHVLVVEGQGEHLAEWVGELVGMVEDGIGCEVLRPNRPGSEVGTPVRTWDESPYGRPTPQWQRDAAARGPRPAELLATAATEHYGSGDLPGWQSDRPSWWNHDARADRLTDWALDARDPSRALMFAQLAAAERTAAAYCQASEDATEQRQATEWVGQQIDEGVGVLVEAIGGTEHTDPPEPPAWLQWVWSSTRGARRRWSR